MNEDIRLPRAAASIAVVIILGFFSLIAAIVILRINGYNESLPILEYALGIVSAAFITIVSYNFGSSWGSRLKDIRPTPTVPTIPIEPVPPVPPVIMPPVTSPTIPPITPPVITPPVIISPIIAPDEDARFLACAQIIDKWEGGYSNDPQDAGGPTNHGITQSVLSEWIGRPASIADVKALSLDTAHQIFRKKYWNPLRCGELPASLALMTYNCGVNSGISRGAKFLQQTLNKQGFNLDIDGEVGPITINAANKSNQKQAVNDYSEIYEAFYKSLGNFATFGKGWLNRLKDVTEAAIALVEATLSDKPSLIPSWLNTAIGLRGLTEVSGGSDNPVILEMARVCGGQIAKEYKHDSIAWCALFVNYCLIASGHKGNDSLWALDMGKLGIKLKGPAVGAIASKKREGGGHTYFVLGKDKSGNIVGIGGNMTDAVRDDVYDPDGTVSYNWPEGATLPNAGSSINDLSTLPVVVPIPYVERKVTL